LQKKSSSKVRQELAGMSIVLLVIKTSSWTWIDFLWRRNFTMGKVQDDVMHDWNNIRQQHVQSFYMDETEVTNFMYLEYLDWLKMFPPSEESYKYIYEASPDTLVWRNRLVITKL
jgi:gliding motility-associated lipoprotein GldJ